TSSRAPSSTLLPVAWTSTPTVPPAMWASTSRRPVDVDAHSSARNVQIALREQGSARHILIGAPVGQQGPTPQLLQDHAMLVYEAGYYALGQASPGSVRTSVEYNLVYH